jgi:hypothetical protein
MEIPAEAMLAPPTPATPSAGSSTGGAGEDAAARVREELEQFKSRFAQAAPKELRGILVEAEDLLVHVCGQQRYDALLAGAEQVIEQIEECRERAKQRRIPNLRATEPEWARLAKEAGVGDELKRRVAGIQYRK